MLKENIIIALNSIKANKLRAILTMLGIIIGIGSVIAIVTIGDSIAAGVNKEMQKFGVRNVEIYVSAKNMDESGQNNDVRAMSENDMISEKMIHEFQKTFKSKLESLTIEETIGQDTIKNKKYKSIINVIGTNEQYLTFNKLKLVSGHFLEEKDIEKGSNHVVVSDKFAKDLYGTNEVALGKVVEIDINKRITNFIIVGVYQLEASQHIDKNTPTNALIPYSTAFKLSRKPMVFQTIKTCPTQGLDVKKFQVEATTFLSSYYTKNDTYDVTTFGMSSMIKSENDMMNKLKLGISAIAAISLLVGGIGIMNIMMVSVTERTKEIGIRMALGAKGSTIRSQFIIESIFVSGIGGIIGIVLGMIVGSIGSKMMGYPATPSIQAAIIAVTFSMMIGIFFGYYPANKASKLDPIEALRYE